MSQGKRAQLSRAGILLALIGVGVFSALTALSIKSLLGEGGTQSPRIVIGWIGPLTGPLSFLGQESAKAIQLEIDEYNASRHSAEPMIELIVKDDRYESGASLELYDQMVAEYRPTAVFVNTYSAMFPIAKRAVRDHVIVINPIDNDRHLSILSPNIFLIAKRSEQLGKILADNLISSGKKKILIYYNSGDDFMPAIAFGLEEKFKQSGITATIHSYSSLKEEEFDEHVGLAKAMNPDGMIFLGYSEAGSLMKKYRSAGLSGNFYAINTAMKETAGAAFEGTHVLQFTSRDRSSIDNFLDRYRGKYQSVIANPWVAFQSYDAIRILMRAIQAADASKISDSLLREQLLHMADFNGLSGMISINEDGSSEGITWSMHVSKRRVD